MTLRWRPLATAAALLAVTAALVGTGVGTSSAGPERPAACARPTPEQPPPTPKPATFTTVGQAYYCIFDNYYSGPVLDSRSLLVPAFAAITQELQRRGLDRADATLPALTGRKDADWSAFGKVYRRIADALPDDDARAAIAAAAVQAMVDALDDNHARWMTRFTPNLYGLDLSVTVGPGDVDPVAAEPAHVNRILANGPADAAGLELGDEVLAINDVPVFVNGILNTAVLSWLTEGRVGSTVRLTVRRPVTGETFTATVTAAQVPSQRPSVVSRLVDGNIAYVTLPGFAPPLADQVLAAIADLRAGTALRGVVLDLRGNGGGSPEAVAKLLGALAHGKVTSYWCDVRDRCTPNRTDDSVALLNLPFVALTDRRCASACDSFTSAVKDLKLGTLVGTRTAGAVSGPGQPYLLDNGTVLGLPKHHEIAANKEVVNTIGVAPDHHVPTTAADLSAGRDPALDKAVSLL
ncbi:carboxyl-terminal processing protease [Saccharothrix carnea]|uniref:Carboxyl-terminal processing protease n=1 Tax=Saccharothrix carnea TaxID=1280637 RepID=A0A2P8HZI6_SACCR|nr:S41 family peptidase [Saccharothrix carnea]PSL51630.1 carboxyl-terminal processing protease [Saccharothrix carnea]